MMSSTPHVLFAPFRVEPEPVMRRLAYRFFLCGLLLLFLMILLCYLGIQPDEAIRRLLPGCLILCGIALSFGTYHQRVDNEGIWDCVLFFWRGWKWNRFSSETIYRAGNTFFDAKAKWWQSDRCSLENFSKQQRDDVLEHIHQIWRSPPLAEQLQLHTFWGWHRSLELFGKIKFDNQWLKVTFSADGVVLDSSARDVVVELLPWSEIRSIDIIRHSSDSPVPGKLLIRFRNARESIPFHLHAQQTDKQTLCQLEPCLEKWSLSGTVKQLTFQGSIRSVRDSLFRKLHHRKQAKDCRNMMKVLIGGFLVYGISLFSTDDLNLRQKCLMFAVAAVVFTGMLIVCFVNYRNLQKPSSANQLRTRDDGNVVG